MDVWAYTLTEEQIAEWQNAYPDEYKQYVEDGLFDPETGELYEVPDWMIDGNPHNGPFDFALAPSHNTIGW